MSPSGDNGRRLTLDSEAALLMRLAVDARFDVVEIGCYHGGTTELLCAATPGGVTVYGIDPVVPDGYGQVGSVENIRAAGAGRGPRFVFIQRPSQDVGAEWAASRPSSVDLVFVDGDHAYEAVRRDHQVWWGVLAPGGHMAFHDAVDSGQPGFVGHPGVIRYTDELLREGWRPMLSHAGVGTLRVFRKPT